MGQKLRTGASLRGGRRDRLDLELGSARVIVEHDVDDHLARVLRVVGSMC